MDLGYLSPTKLEQSRLCRARLKAKYTFNGEYEEEQGGGAKMGTLAHEAAKVWFRGGYFVNNKTGVPVNGIPQAADDWTWTKAESVDQTFKVATQLCADMKTFEGEPNSQVPDDPSGINDARTMFEQIVAFYPRETVRVVFVERKYKGTLSNGVKVSLIIDLGLDRGNGVLEIIDYKTGFITIPDDEMPDKDQVLMNLLATMQDAELAAFPIKQFRYFWVRDSYQSKPFSFDSWERMADYEHWLALEWQSILDDNEPKEQINRFCYSCGRRNECKAYAKYISEAFGGLTMPAEGNINAIITQKAIGMEMPLLPQLVTELSKEFMDQFGTVREMTPADVERITDDEVMARYDRIGTQIKILEKAKEILGGHLKKKMEVVNVRNMEGLTYKATKVTGTTSQPDFDVVAALCEQYKVPLSKVASVGVGKVDDMFAQWPDALNHIKNTSHKFPRAAWVKVTALAPKKQAERKKRMTKAEKAALEAQGGPAVVEQLALPGPTEVSSGPASGNVFTPGPEDTQF